MKSKKEYYKEKARILKSKNSDREKSEQLTNNWFDYIFGFTPEETKLKNQTEKMVFIRS